MPAVDDDVVADRYELLDARLTAAGLGCVGRLGIALGTPRKLRSFLEAPAFSIVQPQRFGGWAENAGAWGKLSL